MKRTWVVAGWLAPIALVLVLVTTNVRLVANSLAVYDTLFERHRVVERTGITPSGLRDVGRQIQDYFNSDVEPLRVVAAVNGVDRELFGPAEVSHMADVKRLFGRTYLVQELSAAFLVALTAALLLTKRPRAYAVMGSWLLRGALLIVATISVLGLASLVAFGPLFTLFHYIGFPQGNWVFDPRTDYLVRVFPFGFWRDVTLMIGGLTMLQALVLGTAGYVLPGILDRRYAKPGIPKSSVPADTPASS